MNLAADRLDDIAGLQGQLKSAGYIAEPALAPCDPQGERIEKRSRKDDKIVDFSGWVGRVGLHIDPGACGRLRWMRQGRQDRGRVLLR